MLTKMCRKLNEEITTLKIENECLKLWNNTFINENKKLDTENVELKKENETKLKDLVKYEKEIQFLKQRNKELRQKSWFEVFEENLKLAEEIKQYQAVLESVEKFVGRFSNEKR
jgi:Iap family predicted aminopeptidase